VRYYLLYQFIERLNPYGLQHGRQILWTNAKVARSEKLLTHSLMVDYRCDMEVGAKIGILFY
jgi:hypothetical protein